MPHYSIMANYRNGVEFFGAARADSIVELETSTFCTKIPDQKLGTLLLEMLNMYTPPAAYTALLARFIGKENAAEYVQENPLEVALYENDIHRIREYVVFYEEKGLPYDDDFFLALSKAHFFHIPDADLFPFEEQVLQRSFKDQATGQTIADIAALYEGFHRLCPPKVSTHHFREDFLTRIAVTSLHELVKAGKQIKHCRNCGKFFLPENRSDEIYCDAPSPQEPAWTCKQYGSRRLWYERQKQDELASLSKKIASAKCMLAKRNPDIAAYTESYEYFKAQRLVWQKAVKQGVRTADEFREWLLKMQSQKIIKEDGTHGND